MKAVIYCMTTVLAAIAMQSPVHAGFSSVCRPIEFRPAALPDFWYVPFPSYSASLSARGGRGPYVFSIVSGALPPGFTLSPQGDITYAGTFVNAGTYGFFVRATDADGCIASRFYSIEVKNCASAPITIGPTLLPDATFPTGYRETIMASGGTPPLVLSLNSGTLPPGIDFVPATGELVGWPTRAGTFDFTIAVDDVHSCATWQTYSLTVECPGGVVLSPLVRPLFVDVPYTAQLSAVSSVEPGSFNVIANSLPDGLMLSSDGLISGTPTTTGTFSFLIRFNPPSDCTVQKGYTLEVNHCPTIGLIDDEIAATAGNTVDARLAGRGGEGPYQFAVASGLLPPGLALMPEGGFRGAPLSAGDYTFAARITDDSGCSRIVPVTLFISAAPTRTPTRTATASASPTRTPTASRTATYATSTPTRTTDVPPTVTHSPTRSRTATGTQTIATHTPTPTRTASAPPLPTLQVDGTPTATRTASLPPTTTRSATATRSTTGATATATRSTALAEATATATPSVTDDHASPTPEQSVGEGTATPSMVASPSPTATPTPTPPDDAACTGDCDGSGEVTVNELLLGVNVALERSRATACMAMDPDLSTAVEVAELVTAVGHALRGCPP